jgi:7-carboxy-7-deazaguanine synthase
MTQDLIYLADKKTGQLKISGKADSSAVQLLFEGCQVNCSVGGFDLTKLQNTEGHTIAEIVEFVAGQGVESVYIAGGEPMLQQNCIDLAKQLYKDGFSVYLDTNCTVDLALLPGKITRIVGLKCPSQGTCFCFVKQYFADSSLDDIIMFDVTDRSDYAWALDVLKRKNMMDYPNIVFAAISDQVTDEELRNWLREDGLGRYLENNFQFIAD